MARNSGTRPGGGVNSAVVKHRPLPKTAKPQANAMSPGGVSQIGSSIGSHATGSGKKLTRGVAPLNAGKGYSTPVGPKPSLPVGVGVGYRQYGQAGTQAVHGPVAGTRPTPGRPILSEFGPDSANVRNRR